VQMLLASVVISGTDVIDDV